MDDDSAVMETHSREFACASRTILGSLGERHCIVYISYERTCALYG